MSVLLTRLTGLATGHPQLSENIKSQLLDVIAKREKKWGRASRVRYNYIYLTLYSMLIL